MKKKVILTEEEFSRLGDFALKMGFTIGGFVSPDIIRQLKRYGVTDKDIEDCKQALFKVAAKAFYNH